MNAGCVPNRDARGGVSAFTCNFVSLSDAATAECDFRSSSRVTHVGQLSSHSDILRTTSIGSFVCFRPDGPISLSLKAFRTMENGLLYLRCMFLAPRLQLGRTDRMQMAGLT